MYILLIVYTRTYTYTCVHSHVQKKTEGLGWRVCMMRTYGETTLGSIFFVTFVGVCTRRSNGETDIGGVFCEQRCVVRWA